MYQTTLPAKSSAARRYDPVDDLILLDDVPVVAREAAEQNEDARPVAEGGAPHGGMAAALSGHVADHPKKAWPSKATAMPPAAKSAFGEEPMRGVQPGAAVPQSSELSYLDLLSTGGLQDTCRQAIDEHSRGPRRTSGCHTSAVEVADPPEVDQPISEAVGGLEAVMLEPVSAVAGESVGEDAELDVTVDPLDASVVGAGTSDEETWVEDCEDEGDRREAGVVGESEIVLTETAPAATEMPATKTPVEGATGEAVVLDLWSAPTVTGKPMPALPPKGSIAALGIPRAAGAPERIGSGRLVATRLTWKPREASVAGARSKREFRWDTMLTAACVTAACGIGCIWLLRAILA